MVFLNLLEHPEIEQWPIVLHTLYIFVIVQIKICNKEFL